VQLIQTAADLASLVERLRREPLVAVDTEAASFHRYQDRIYLLQLSSRQETAVVDPLAAGTLAPIGELLADPAVEIVFHDADYDLRLLDREYNLHAEASWALPRSQRTVRTRVGWRRRICSTSRKPRSPRKILARARQERWWVRTRL